jgi:hypothetical protein
MVGAYSTCRFVSVKDISGDSIGVAADIEMVCPKQRYFIRLTMEDSKTLSMHMIETSVRPRVLWCHGSPEPDDGDLVIESPKDGLGHHENCVLDANTRAYRQFDAKKFCPVSWECNFAVIGKDEWHIERIIGYPVLQSVPTKVQEQIAVTRNSCSGKAITSGDEGLKRFTFNGAPALLADTYCGTGDTHAIEIYAWEKVFSIYTQGPARLNTEHGEFKSMDLRVFAGDHGCLDSDRPRVACNAVVRWNGAAFTYDLMSNAPTPDPRIKQ